MFAPVALHAAFDFPLLTLQKNPDLGSTTRLLLGTASVLIGFSSIGFAVRLVRRVGRHHAPRTEIARERLSQLRRMWALLVAGGGAGFAGVAFLLTSLHHWFVSPGAQRVAGSDPDRPHIDPDRPCAAGGYHGSLHFRTQPDADDVGGFFVRPPGRLAHGYELDRIVPARDRFRFAPKRSNIRSRIPGELQ